MDKDKLNEILNLHKLYLKGADEGRGANLSDADLRSAYLSGANLRDADLRSANLSDADLSGADLSDAALSGADLSDADLSGADLSGANLRSAYLSGANLRGAYLSGADLSGANLRGANLSDADLSGADLSGANLSGAYLSGANLSDAYLRSVDLRDADLSGATGLVRPQEWLSAFATDELGIMVYKRIGNNKTYADAPDYWTIEPGAFLEEVVNPSKTTVCGSGVNFGTRSWCDGNYTHANLWLCRIRWIDLAGVVVSYSTDGKARCNRLELIEIVESGAQEVFVQ